MDSVKEVVAAQESCKEMASSCQDLVDSCKEVANSCKEVVDSCRELADSWKTLEAMAADLLSSWERFKVQQAAATSSRAAVISSPSTTTTTPPPTAPVPPPAMSKEASTDIESAVDRPLPLHVVPELAMPTPATCSTECRDVLPKHCKATSVALAGTDVFTLVPKAAVLWATTQPPPEFLLVVHGVSRIWLQCLQWCASVAFLSQARGLENIHLTIRQWDPGIFWLPSMRSPSWTFKVPGFSLCAQKSNQLLVLHLMIAPLSLCALKKFGSQAVLRFSRAIFVTATKNMLPTKYQDYVNGASFKQIKMVHSVPFLQFERKEMLLNALVLAGAELLPHGRSASAIQVPQPANHGVDYNIFHLMVTRREVKVSQNMQFRTAICWFRFSPRLKMLSDCWPIGGQNGSLHELLGQNLSLTEDKKMHMIGVVGPIKELNCGISVMSATSVREKPSRDIFQISGEHSHEKNTNVLVLLPERLLPLQRPQVASQEPDPALGNGGMSWNEAWSITKRMVAYTHHTVFPEANDVQGLDSSIQGFNSLLSTRPYYGCYWFLQFGQLQVATTAFPLITKCSHLHLGIYKLQFHEYYWDPGDSLLSVCPGHVPERRKATLLPSHG